MTTQKTAPQPRPAALPALVQALAAESWQWLSDQQPEIADALSTEIGRGATPSQIRATVMRLTDRRELAVRCELAAQYLAAQD